MKGFNSILMKYKITILQKHLDIIMNHGKNVPHLRSCGFLGGTFTNDHKIINCIYPIKRYYIDAVCTFEIKDAEYYFGQNNAEIQGLYIIDYKKYLRHKTVNLYRCWKAPTTLIHIDISCQTPIIISPVGTLNVINSLSDITDENANADISDHNPPLLTNQMVSNYNKIYQGEP